MTRFWIGCLAVTALFSSTVCSAALRATPQLTQELMAKSGLNKQVANIPKLVLYGLDGARRQTEQPLNLEVYENLKSAILSSFRPDEILKTISQHVDSDLNKYDIEAILQWLDSPLGRKITALEESTSTPEAYLSMMSRKDELLKNTARVEKMKALDAAIKETEFNLDLQINMQIAIASSIAAALVPDNNMVFERISAAAEAGRSKMEPHVREETLVSQLYTYQTLTDAEIDRLIAFSSSDLGQIYYDATSQGFKIGFMNASRKLGKALMQIYR
jgi:hypothetical protein